MWVEKFQKCVVCIGFDWVDLCDILVKFEEEKIEIEEVIVLDNVDYIEEEIGDVLFVIVNLVWCLKVDFEIVLCKVNCKFEC